MKTEIIKIALISLSALSFSTIKAQDTTKIKDSKETIIVHDSTNARPVQPVVHDTVVKTAPPVIDKKEDNPRLHSLELGVRYMPTFSSMALRTYEGDVIQGQTTMSNGYGAMISVTGKHVGLQGEVDYLQISQKYKDRNLDRVVDINYLNIPVLLTFNTDKTQMVNWNVVIGPQFGVNVGAKTNTNGGASTDTLRAVVAVKKGDVGIAYGTGLDFMVNKMHTIRIDLGFRGFYGLVDMNAKSTQYSPDTYNVIVKASRKTYGGYLGLTFLF